MYSFFFLFIFLLGIPTSLYMYCFALLGSGILDVA